MGNRERLGAVAVVVVLVGMALRSVALLVGPLPATLDGFRYVTLAQTTVAGGVPWATIDADELVVTLLLGTASLVTGRGALTLAQPLATVIGGLIPLVGVAIVGRLAIERRWTGRPVRLAALLAGLGLAAEGLFLRRTAVPDEEVVGLLLVPLLAIAVYRAVTTKRPAWVVVAVAFLGVLPPLHNLTAMIGVLTVTALAALHLIRARDRTTAGLAVGLASLGWAVLVAHHLVARFLGLAITYSGLLADHPGLFGAWVILLVVGVVWVRSASLRAVQVVYLVPVGLLFAIVAVNAVTPVFPGTIRSPPLVVGLVMGLAVPVVFAAGAIDLTRQGTGLALLALFAAPIALTFYALTAELTPEFFGAVMRIQTFAHPSVLVLAGVVAAGVGRERVPTRVDWSDIATAVLVLAIVVTLPLGYMALDTATLSPGMPPASYEASAFASTHVQGGYATDHALSRVGIHAFQDETVAYGPVAGWLAGGPPPSCTVLARHTWTTTGAHLFPGAPRTIEPDRYRAWRRANHQVYDGDDLVVVVPARNRIGRCVGP